MPKKRKIKFKKNNQKKSKRSSTKNVDEEKEIKPQVAEKEEIVKEKEIKPQQPEKDKIIEEKDKKILEGKMEDPVFSTIKKEFEQDLKIYSEIQKTLTHEKLTINQLTKKINKMNQEKKEFEIQWNKDIVGRELEIKVLKRTLKEMSDEIERLKRKSRLIREKFQLGIISELKEFLTKKLDVIENTVPSKTIIETKTQHFLTTIQELETTIKLKNSQLNMYHSEIKKLREQVNQSEPSQQRFKDLIIRVNQENKTLKNYVERLIKDNELLRKEIEKINEELSN